jgi:hypothetical protein
VRVSPFNGLLELASELELGTDFTGPARPTTYANQSDALVYIQKRQTKDTDKNNQINQGT